MYMYRIYRVIIKYCNILCCWSISSTDNYFITPKFKKSLDLPLKHLYFWSKKRQYNILMNIFKFRIKIYTYV